MSKTPPLPTGFGIELDSWTRQLTPELWFGGSPVRIARLTPVGQAAFGELQRKARVTSRAAGVLARYLTDAGLAHPVPPTRRATPDVTVIVPVRDRIGMLARCLTALGSEYPVIVVDDGSRNPAAVERVAADHGARLIRRDVNGGPGAARNSGLADTTSDLVAFVDSDCEPPPDWISRLAAHFADPLVAVAAPRISGWAGRSTAGRYTESNGALDLGGRPGRVMPKAAISYVPAAAVLVRRRALDDIRFDESLRVGEDVDLIWRLHEAGWRIRYDPSVQVPHHEPATLVELLARRYRYGTSAAPLAQRHPGDVVHLALQPWPTLTIAALLTRRPALAAAAFAGALATTGYRLHRAAVPRAGLTRATAASTRQTWLALGRYGTQFAAPLLAAGIAAPGLTRRGDSGGRLPGLTRRGDSGGRPPGLTRRLARRAAIASLVLGPPLTAWAEGPRTLDPARFTLARIADDLAYGLGVWSGCVTVRTLAPLRPVIAWRPLLIDPLYSKPREEPES